MREIKFRAWWKGKSEWIDRFKVDRDGQTISYWNEKEERYEALFVGLDVELMQYTGLKDKNGKEIYEGDILRRRKGKLPTKLRPGKTPGFEKRVVEWVDGYRSRTGFNISKCVAYPWEIIGNIYENQDLLPSNE